MIGKVVLNGSETITKSGATTNEILVAGEDLKKEILEENLRLLYIAITRAKRKLYFTCSKKQKNYYGKEEKIEENMIFNELLQTKVIN